MAYIVISQTDTNTGSSNTNHNQNTARGRHGQVSSGVQGCGGHASNRRNSSIVKYSFEGKMKDGCLSKLTITESTHQTIQCKKSYLYSTSLLCRQEITDPHQYNLYK